METQSSGLQSRSRIASDLKTQSQILYFQDTFMETKFILGAIIFPIHAFQCRRTTTKLRILLCTWSLLYISVDRQRYYHLWFHLIFDFIDNWFIVILWNKGDPYFQIQVEYVSEVALFTSHYTLWSTKSYL